MDVKKNFLTFKMSKELEQLLTKYDLSVGEVYWVLRSTFLQVEKMYLDTVQKEMDEIQEDKADERDNDVDSK